jgi:hypothetical protein
MNFEKKYLKYKQKYLALKLQTGGMDFTNKDISKFCLHIFTFLKQKQPNKNANIFDVCFINGELIFEDSDNKLFNLLTYNKLVVQHNEHTCPNKIHESKTHFTATHTNFETGNNELRLDHCIHLGLATKNTFKFERILDPPIEYLCDQETQIKDADVNNNEKKEVILYYPFTNTITGKKYLFVKFESHPMNSVAHVKNLLDKSRHTTYPLRRDSDTNKTQFDATDKAFYQHCFDEKVVAVELANLEEYNSKVRVGNEFYVTNTLLNQLIETFKKMIMN